MRRQAGSRRGATVIIVLGLVAITLALSYAVLRSQSTTVRIQQNSGAQDAARQAALTGLNVGLRAMHESNWPGVSSTLSRQISAGQRFEVTYATGDSQLTAASADYAEFPYRVTLTSTGYATDALTQREITHITEAVVRLIPRQLATEPAGWPSMFATHALYQWGSGSDDGCAWEVPFRVDGPVRLQGQMQLLRDNPSNEAYRERFLRDLKNMFAAANGDYRPFTGPVELDYNRTAGDQRGLLSTQLGVTVTSITPTIPGEWLPPVSGSYRLYPGGKIYVMSTLPQTLASATYEPDVQTNPLGIYYRSGSALAASVLIGNNVTIRGSLYTSGDVVLSGTNIRFQPISLPAIYGASQPVQLPVLAAGDDVFVLGNTSGSVDGAMIAGDALSFEEGPQDLGVAIRGRVVTRVVTVKERSEWDVGDGQWDTFWNQFSTQQGLPGGMSYFPRWLEMRGLRIQPLLTVARESTPVRYFVPQGPNALVVYAPHPDDGGLRWEMLSWTDG